MSFQKQAEEVATKKIPGFVSRERIRRLECDWLSPEEGAEQLWADVNVKMSIDEVDQFGELFGGSPSFADLWIWLTPRVKAWNAVAFDEATQEYVPVPPPAEAGEAAFRVVDPVITTWLAFALKQAALGGDLKKEGTQSGTTPEPANASG